MIAYNHTTNIVASKAFTYSSELTLVLLSPSAIFNQAHTTRAEVTNLGEWEMYGGNWPANGFSIPNVVVATVDESSLAITGSSVDIMPTATFGPIRYAVLLATSETGDPPLGFHDFESDFNVQESFQLLLPWEAGYIMKIVLAA